MIKNIIIIDFFCVLSTSNVLYDIFTVNEPEPSTSGLYQTDFSTSGDDDTGFSQDESRQASIASENDDLGKKYFMNLLHKNNIVDYFLGFIDFKCHA